MNLNNSIKDGQIAVFLDSRIYSKEGISKCLYWYSDKFNISINIIGNHFKIELKPNMENQKLELEIILEKLVKDFLDFNLRQIVTSETQNVRDLLIAKAFSNGEFDEPPIGEISDPVGFKF